MELLIDHPRPRSVLAKPAAVELAEVFVSEADHVPLFALLDDEEAAVLAAQVELKTFAPRQRIYKMGDPPRHAYIMLSGTVRVTTVDEDHQEVLVDEPGHGDFFGFASMAAAVR